MTEVVLGSTEIKVNKNGFGALPIQRISHEDAGELLKMAYNAGINFFDTARFYTDSETKIGEALGDVRENIYIATKTAAQNSDDFWKDLNTSLNNLKTDYIDIYQFHNPSFCPKPGDGTGLYEAMLEAKAQGKIRHIGITNHRLNVANEAIESGLYETLQFPFNYLATEKEHELVEVCRSKNMGFIAMKALSGGLITNSKAAYAYQAEYDNVFAVMLIAFASVYIEKKSSMDKLINSSSGGFKYVNKKKLISVGLITLLLTLAVNIIEYTNLIRYYKVTYFQAPVQSLTFMSDIKINVSVIGWLLLLIVFKLIISTVTFSVTFIITRMVSKK